MNSRSIEYFLVTAEELNFTRAAERLFISQQALSSHIKRLEDEYNIELFERKPTTRLTLAGQQMALYGRQILEAEKNMRAAFSDINKNCLGNMKIGMARLRSHVFFPLLWNHYHASHPNISVELVNGNTNALSELLEIGKIDLYIGVDVPEVPNQKRIKLTSEKIHCCFTRDLFKKYAPLDFQQRLAEMNDGIDLRKIMDLPLITMRKGNRLRNALDSFCAHELNPHYIFECDQQELIYDMALQGQGVGILSPAILYQHLQELTQLKDNFYVFPLQSDFKESYIYLVYRTDYTIPSFVMDFIETASIIFSSYSKSMKLRF